MEETCCLNEVPPPSISMESPLFIGDESLIGQTIPIKVIQSLPFSLRGEIEH